MLCIRLVLVLCFAMFIDHPETRKTRKEQQSNVTLIVWWSMDSRSKYASRITSFNTNAPIVHSSELRILLMHLPHFCIGRAIEMREYIEYWFRFICVECCSLEMGKNFSRLRIRPVNTKSCNVITICSIKYEEIKKLRNIIYIINQHVLKIIYCSIQIPSTATLEKDDFFPHLFPT